MKTLQIFLVAFVFSIALSTFRPTDVHFRRLYAPNVVADLVFHNGNIITMNSDNETADALAILNNTIIGVGKMGDMAKMIGSTTKKVNLKKKTIVPGFYDGHSHYSLSAVLATQGFNLFSAPFGNVTSIADIIANVKKYITDNNIPPGSNVYGSGYDQTKLTEQRFPTKVDLDQISTQHYILLVHYSGHMGSVNSLVLQDLGTTSQTVVPGGTIELGDDGQPNGVFKEQAVITYANKFWGKVTSAKVIETQSVYFSAGYTTAQDTTTDGSEIRAYLGAGDNLKLDINGYQFINVASPAPLTYYNIFKGQKSNRFSIKGVKTFLDGSIQLQSAALSQPYYSRPAVLGPSPPLPTPSQIDPVLQSQDCTQSWCGKLNFPQSLVNTLFQQLLNNDVDCIIHCNGDAASGQFIEGVRSARNATNLNQQTRLTINHVQTITDKQLDDAHALNIGISIFEPQLFFNGDQYKNVQLGAVRAARIIPAKSAINKNVRFSLHTDAPVFPLNYYGPLQIISTAVNRKTITGNVLGAQQAITAYQALRALTIDAAWQGREDSTKGSIEVGKKADFVILSDNPLTVDASQIGSISVVSTYKGGEQVYSVPQN